MILNKVRKTSQAALLVLLEQGLADTRDVEQQVKRVARVDSTICIVAEALMLECNLLLKICSLVRSVL